jgi:hypothetical protein
VVNDYFIFSGPHGIKQLKHDLCCRVPDKSVVPLQVVS